MLYTLPAIEDLENDEVTVIMQAGAASVFCELEGAKSIVIKPGSKQSGQYTIKVLLNDALNTATYQFILNVEAVVVIDDPIKNRSAV